MDPVNVMPLGVSFSSETWWFIHQYLPFFKEYLERTADYSLPDFMNLVEARKVLLLEEYILLQVSPEVASS
jgi:hypothetical protein